MANRNLFGDAIRCEIDNADRVGTGIRNQRDALCLMNGDAFGRASSNRYGRHQLERLQIQHAHAVARLVGHQHCIPRLIQSHARRE